MATYDAAALSKKTIAELKGICRDQGRDLVCHRLVGCIESLALHILKPASIHKYHQGEDS